MSYVRSLMAESRLTVEIMVPALPLTGWPSMLPVSRVGNDVTHKNFQ